MTNLKFEIYNGHFQTGHSYQPSFLNFLSLRERLSKNIIHHTTRNLTFIVEDHIDPMPYIIPINLQSQK